jgi:dipeptidase E
MELLLLSNSTTQGYSYLEHAISTIKSFFGTKCKKIAFVPYAGVTINWDDYTTKVAGFFKELGYEIVSVHSGDADSIIDSADAIAVGGGNTFNLLKTIYDNGLNDIIETKVRSGMPYIGWSAGSNLACPTICTTNDMPIVEPPSFKAFGFVPFQINPHYLDAHPDGHHGETREQRILEYLEANRNSSVVGLREGSSFLFNGKKLELIGSKQARIFKYGTEIFELNPGDDFSFLL